MIELNKIYNEDCLEGMKRIPDGMIDLVVTSPPYDNLRKYGGVWQGWDMETFISIAKELTRVLKDGGVIVWNVNDATYKGSKTGNSFRQCLTFIDLGLNLNDTMIWRKTNPMPQVKQPRYSACFEYMFVFSKGKPSVFNPIMRKTKCGGRIYNSTCKKIGGEQGRTEKYFNINTDAVEYNVWDIAVCQNKTGHPAVFPIEIPLRHIKSWSNEGQIILDPFIGSGTTAIACIKEKRKFIGFELNNQYFELAQERIKREFEDIKLF